MKSTNKNQFTEVLVSNYFFLNLKTFYYRNYTITKSINNVKKNVLEFLKKIPNILKF